jgi:hypothetical protein
VELFFIREADLCLFQRENRKHAQELLPISLTFRPEKEIAVKGLIGLRGME